MLNQISRFIRQARETGHLAAATALLSLSFAGCASYVTPGRAADMRVFGAAATTNPSIDEQSDPSVVRSIDKQPLANFPSSIAVARVQAPGYTSATAQGWGSGRYSIITTRDVEEPKQLDRLSHLPLVSGIAPLNRLLLPPELNSDVELRRAAAALHADLLLIYTRDTQFLVEDSAAPLTVVSLGLSPTQQARVVSTASAVLMDTRNGYVYGTAEATEKQNQIASAWTSDSAVDQSRRRAETKAFEKLVNEFEKTWSGVVQSYGTSRPAVEVK